MEKRWIIIYDVHRKSYKTFKDLCIPVLKSKSIAELIKMTFF